MGLSRWLRSASALGVGDLLWLAAGSSPPGLNEVVIAVSGVLVAVITAIAGVAVAMINAKRSDTDRDPRHSTAEDMGHLRERTAVLERRAQDSDERDETQDRRLDVIERALDLENVNWHPDGHDHG